MPGLNLQAWPHANADRNPKTLAEFIGRVNAQPGGFRSVTREKLEAEIAAKKNGCTDVADAETGDDEEDEDEAQEVDDTKMPMTEFQRARDEVYKNIEVAHQTALQTLDLVSLLLTKELPTQAGATLSPYLRNLVGIGTLGADKVSASNITDARLLDNKLVSTGWKFTDIDKTVENVVEAATRLQKEIELETKYWAEVLGVSEGGWSVTGMPGESHTLGVRYGLSEGGAATRDAGLAAMPRGERGDAMLECGPKLEQAKKIHVKIEKTGKVTGRSNLPTALPSDASLEARVLQARDTAFAQELWLELNKECRGLLSYDIRYENERIMWQVDKTTRMFIALETTDESDGPEQSSSQTSREDNDRAQSIQAILELLLLYAHRQNSRQRQGLQRQQNGHEPPPHALLRPLMAQDLHEKALTQSCKFFANLTKTLRAAGFQKAAYNITEAAAATATANGLRAAASEDLIQSLLRSFEFQVVLTITKDTRLLIRARTFFQPVVTSTYTIQIIPPSDIDTKSDLVSLQDVYPPGNMYNSFDQVTYYILQALPNYFTAVAEGRTTGTTAGDKAEVVTNEWVRSISGTQLKSPSGRAMLGFSLSGPSGVAEDDDQNAHMILRLAAASLDESNRVTQKTHMWSTGDTEAPEQPLMTIIDNFITQEQQRSKAAADAEPTAEPGTGPNIEE